MDSESKCDVHLTGLRIVSSKALREMSDPVTTSNLNLLALLNKCSEATTVSAFTTYPIR